jgi:hypothetical protein
VSLISPNEGTIGTEITITGSGFGAKKGSILLGDKALTVREWTDDSIQCLLSKALLPDAYDVTIRPRTKGSAPVMIEDGFTVKAPEINSVDPASGSAGDQITIHGFFFGAKKGKVTLGGKRCKVLGWTMDSETGESEIQFVVPKGLDSGTKELQVSNGVGSDIIQVAGTDYSGTYCFILEKTDSIMATEVVINQSNGTVTLTLADLANLSVTGLLNGNTLTLTEQIPNAGELDMVVTFSNDGQILSGTYTMGPEQGTVTGSKHPCANYTYPEGNPVCILPVENLSLVTGGQQYNSVYNGTMHTGLDFKFGATLPNIIAPCDGVIKGINRHAISEGNIIFDVDIRYNQNWSTFIAFEPYSPDPTIADMQENEISVTINQVVKRGDLLGRLIALSTAFPHIHWGVNRNEVDGGPVCPRDYLLPQAQLELDNLYDHLPGPFGGNLLPACLP